MNRITVTLAAVLFSILPASAQMSSEQYKARYERQARAVGASGVGVETILDRWAEIDPDNTDMLEARFRLYFDRSRSTELVKKEGERHLGEKAVLSLPDSSGKMVGFFEESFFVDSLFALSAKAIDRAIAVSPSELSYRFEKIAALMAYEKDSPDMTKAELMSLIEMEKNKTYEWTYQGEAPEADFFETAIQEYCYSFYRLASPQSFEAFREMSEVMAKLYPSNTVFMSNLGSYWLVARKDYKKAVKCYSKVLKANPKDYIALKNTIIAARTQGNSRLEKKHLPAFIEVTPVESEKLSSQARLEYLSK